MIRMTSFVVLSAAVLAGCAKSPARRDAPPSPETAVADFIDEKGQNVGSATLAQSSRGVRILIEFRGLPPGERALHIHNTGQCHAGTEGGKSFQSAGPHFNPFNRKHGLNNPDGPHAGDLPNFTVAEDGTASVEVFAELVTLEDGKVNSLFKPGGTCLVVHARPDDNISDPDGKGGNRIACAEIRRDTSHKGSR